MAWTGFIALGNVAANVFTESVATGYARAPFTFSDPKQGKVQGSGAAIPFTTTSANVAYNAYGFFNAVSGGSPILVYPLNIASTFGASAPVTVSPSTVVFDLIDGQTGNGLPLDMGGAGAIAGTQPVIQAYSNASGLTARAGGGQALATLLTATVNRVTVAATSGDSVKLPPAVPGLSITIINNGANPIQVYGSGTDTINGVATATGVSQPVSSVDTYWCAAAGLWHAEVGEGYSGGLFTESSADNIVAHAGGGQGSATPILSQTARITTVASPGDSVVLPASAAGLELIIVNNGANSLQVYGLGTDTIDGVAAGTGVSQMVNSMCIYTSASAGAWTSNGLGTGYSGSLPTQSFANAITAFAGGGQASATLLTTVINRVSTVATAGDSVKLPVSAGGLTITVCNAHATNSLNVFPQTGDQINALGVNVASPIAAGKTASFYCCVAGTWHSLVSA